LKGRCSTELLQYNCSDIDPQDPQYIQVWKSSKTICVERDPTASFFASNDDICAETIIPLGYKKCGSGSRSVCRESSK
jgi:hypothetical protein